MLPWPRGLHRGQGLLHHPQPFPGGWIFLSRWLFGPGATVAAGAGSAQPWPGWIQAATALGIIQSRLHPLSAPSAPLLSRRAPRPSPPWMLFSRRARFVLATVRGAPRAPGTGKLRWLRAALRQRNPRKKTKQNKTKSPGGGASPGTASPSPPSSCPPTKATTAGCCPPWCYAAPTCRGPPCVLFLCLEIKPGATRSRCLLG